MSKKYCPVASQPASQTSEFVSQNENEMKTVWPDRPWLECNKHA